LIHIDGSHLYKNVATDIQLCRRLLVEQGVMVLDDWASYRSPGVAAAVWEAVLSGGLRPICATQDKLYCTEGALPAGFDLDAEKTVVEVAGHTLVQFHELKPSGIARLVEKWAPAATQQTIARIAARLRLARRRARFES
jgi:hypothetical protein